MSLHHVKVVEGGKIVLPAGLRRRFNIEVGDTLVVDGAGGVIAIRSLDQVVANAQTVMSRYAPKESILSDELVSERHARADRE